MPSSCNEIVKQLVWNSLMKGLVLKVKLIYVTSAWSQSCSVIFRECALRRTAEWSPRLCSYWQGRKQMKTAASSSARQSAGSATHFSGKQLSHGGPLRGQQAGRRRMVQSNDRAMVIKPARPRPGTAPGLQVCHGKGTKKECTLLFGETPVCERCSWVLANTLEPNDQAFLSFSDC